MTPLFIKARNWKYLVPEPGTKRLIFSEPNRNVAGGFAFEGDSSGSNSYAIYSFSANAYVTVAPDGYLVPTLTQSPWLTSLKSKSIFILEQYKGDPPIPDSFQLRLAGQLVYFMDDWSLTITPQGEGEFEPASLIMETDTPPFVGGINVVYAQG